MEEGKKGPLVEELLDRDAKGINNRSNDPPKEPRGNDAKDLHCRCCSEHLSPKPKPTPMPCGHKKGGRNLVVCIDGTANQFGKKNTNVIEIYNLVMKDTDDNQHTWYNSGIGTYARPHWASLKYRKQVFVHTVDLAIAWNFDLTILAAYQWLADNYQDGDCIFLFGFSRGAFQVRVLSAMIAKIGLIYKGNEKQIPFAYELYADPQTDLPEDEQAESSLFERLKRLLRLAKKETQTQDQSGMGALSMAERFKRAFSRSNVKVHFVGVWDTVSSIGIVRGKQMLPGTIDGMRHVCYFRHALALDERRVKFQPEYAWGGTTLPPGTTVPESKDEAGDNGRDKPSEHTLEVWFAGTHSDIGGGNAKNIGMDRSRPPSRWMASEAETLGLRLKPFERELSSSEQIEFQESLKGLWHLFEILPFRRLTFARSTGAKLNTFVPHLWSARKIHAGQKIHSSLILADTPYIPRARPPRDEPDEPANEDNSRHDADSPDLDDSDLSFESEAHAGSGSAEGGTEPESDQGGRLRRLLRRVHPTRLADTPETRERVFWDNLRKNGLANPEGWLEIDLAGYAKLLLKRLVDGRGGDGELKEIVEKYPKSGAQAVYDETIEAIRLWKENPPDLEAQHRVLHTAVETLEGHLEKLMFRKWREIRIPLGEILRGTGTRRDLAKRFLDHFTTDVNCLFELRGHTNWVLSVTISPNGNRIVSGSWDETIRIWDAETGAQVGEPLQGHTNSVWSVAISLDGKHIVSGSRDNTIRIWDLESGAQLGEPLQGHTETVYSVAISPDGKHIVSGSGDQTIRIWDAETRKQVGEPLRGHTEPVFSVAISPDGKHIVSGSWDDTIRVWNLETGVPVGEPLRGHTGDVYSVAISPDGKRIVSGSDDKTIRIWDSETGAQVGEPLRGHTSRVISVAISRDGKRIVSGSIDETIRIWDLETGAKVGKPLRGHTGTVWSVAISPDSKRIVSGSHDSTIRMWSAEGILD